MSRMFMHFFNYHKQYIPKTPIYIKQFVPNDKHQRSTHYATHLTETCSLAFSAKTTLKSDIFITKSEPDYRNDKDTSASMFLHHFAAAWGGEETWKPAIISSTFVRLVSPEIFLLVQMRVSCLCAIPSLTGRGRHHKRVSPARSVSGRKRRVELSCLHCKLN